MHAGNSPLQQSPPGASPPSVPSSPANSPLPSASPAQQPSAASTSPSQQTPPAAPPSPSQQSPAASPLPSQQSPAAASPSSTPSGVGQVILSAILSYTRHIASRVDFVSPYLKASGQSNSVMASLKEFRFAVHPSADAKQLPCQSRSGMGCCSFHVLIHRSFIHSIICQATFLPSSLCWTLILLL